MSLSYNDEVPPVVGKNPPPSLFNFGASSKKTWLLIGGGVVAIVVAILLLFASGGDNIGPQAQRLIARLSTLHEIARDSQDNIQSADLSKINSDVRIITLGNINRLREPFVAAGMGEASGSVLAAEEDLASRDDLEEARLMGTFDTAYVRFLSYKIDTILPLLSEIYDNTSDPALREPLERSFEDYSALREQLDELNI